ncbi:GNAT family N-acetyltransferase [Streptomyces mangrovisoli]|uniref:GNAT family N-acetyltransferase n=1 Tax=Streptomyces mangrovisoli TaxID=1428628 RepID=A0A1J4P1B4_9ACTN|nr:GNAT family protein [Streptomyces mangrovisoli]OIJ68018.1 GNAT family N-acetyltransferase [Streptomyces mangrovisoli]
MSDEITLRPVTADDLDLFERERGGPEGTGPYQWFGYGSSAALRRQFADNGLLGQDGGVLSVAEAGLTVGRVEWFAGSWGRPATSTCWSLAIGLVPAVRGRGIGTRAQRLLAEYLFDHTRAERLQAWTDCANLAEQRALEKAGFVKEGVLRSAQWRGGRWHDQVLFSMLRADHESRRAAAS